MPTATAADWSRGTPDPCGGDGQRAPAPPAFGRSRGMLPGRCLLPAKVHAVQRRQGHRTLNGWEVVLLWAWLRFLVTGPSGLS